jgi:hypothetical protein
MAIWNCELTVGRMTRAVLIDSVTERPLNLPAFDDKYAAERFLAYAHERGCRDVRALTGAELEALHAGWRDAGERDDEDEKDGGEEATP